MSRDEVSAGAQRFHHDASKARPRSASASTNTCARCWSARSARRRPSASSIASCSAAPAQGPRSAQVDGFARGRRADPQRTSADHRHRAVVSRADQAAEVLGHFCRRALRSDLIMRIATLDGMQPTALHELDEMIEKQFAGQHRRGSRARHSAASRPRPKCSTSGLDAEGARRSSRSRKADERARQKIQDLMFVFDDLVEIDDRGMQELLRAGAGRQAAARAQGRGRGVQGRRSSRTCRSARPKC